MFVYGHFDMMPKTKTKKSIMAKAQALEFENDVLCTSNSKSIMCLYCKYIG